jgi:hypothetical protein
MNSCFNYCNLNVKVDRIFLYLYSLISLCHVHNSLKGVFGTLKTFLAMFPTHSIVLYHRLAWHEK